VNQSRQVAGEVVPILVRAGPHGVSVAGTQKPRSGQIVIGRRRGRKRRGAVEVQLLAATGEDESIDRVAGVIGAGNVGCHFVVSLGEAACELAKT
jgi:hypothetical protein